MIKVIDDFCNLNFVNFKTYNPTTLIYRFISFDRLMEILLNKQITLVNIKNWDDPYENILSKCTFRFDKERDINISDLQNQIFGQSWTLTNESDALWRIYSNDKKGVRIKTCTGKLSDATLNKAKSTIGIVEYIDEKEMEHKIINETDSLNVMQLKYLIKTLLYKRIEFQHENEVRILYQGDDNEKSNQIKFFNIEPNEFIEDILFDPRMDNHTVETYTKAIKKFGYKGSVSKSKLYDVKPIIIRE